MSAIKYLCFRGYLCYADFNLCKQWKCNGLSEAINGQSGGDEQIIMIKHSFTGWHFLKVVKFVIKDDVIM